MTANSNSADKANMGAVPLSADILVRANIGLWAFELDEGKEPRMYVDDNMLALIGLTEQTTPEKTYHAWYDHIDPDHYDEVSESVEKMTQGIHAEVSYPWHHPTKGVMYVRCGGVRNFAYTDGIRLEGCHQDISMIMHFQKQQAETAQGVKTFSDLFIDQFVSAYYIEIETGSMIIYRQEDHLNKKYGSVINYRESIKKYIAEDVHPEDRGKLLHVCDIEYIKKRLRTESQFSVVFRDMSIGSERLLRLQVTRGSDENHVAMGFMDVTENIKNTIKETNEKRTFSDIANALAGRYENVYLIDADDETYQDFNASGKPGNINLKYMESGKNFFEEIQNTIDAVIFEKDRAMIKKFLSRENLLSAVENGIAVSPDYRVITDEGTVYYRICALKNALDGNRIIVAVENTDDIVKAEKQHQQKLKENLEMIDILASQYSSVYFVDLPTNKITAYNMSNAVVSEYGHIFKKNMSYSESLKIYAETVAYPGDTEMILSSASIENVKEKLRFRKAFTLVHRRLVDGVIRYYEMRFVKSNNDNDEPTSFIWAFANRDKEIVTRYINEKLTAEYASIFLIDLENDKYRFIARSAFSGFSDVESGSYSKFIGEYASRVDGEYVDFWNNISDIGFMKNYLSKEDRREFTYILNGVDRKWRRCVCRVLERGKDSVNSFIMTFTVLDDSSAEKQELDAKIASQKKELENQQILLESALERAEAANNAKTVFLSNMSHDIRTPMNAIIGFTTLALQKPDDAEKLQNYLTKINVSSQHLLSLINDILDMSRIESGKLSLEEVNCNLANVMHDLNTIILGQAQAKQQNLYIDSVDIQDEDVVCDMLRLHQVLINLLSNAIKFTPSGGNIYVRVRQTFSEGGIGKYDFVVKDDGIGMSKEFADRIFEPFERERTSTVSKTQGTGLGMSITKTIIDLMGGTIEVHTEQGKGTEFVIHLTLKLQDKNRFIEPISELLGKRVLIIDDDKNSCESASSLISTFGLCTEWTLFGSEALKIAEAAAKASTPFDAYIIDWKMPDTPGFEVIKNLREKFGADIPIIIMSAYDRATIEEEAGICDVAEFMSKPLFLSEMYDVLTRVFGCKNDLSSGAEAEEISFAGKKILLVEDNELNREIATEILEERGFIVDTADDGTVAVDKVKAAKAGAYDAILMDIQMPIMDGYEATRQIRASACPLAKIPIIAMTANAFAEDRKAAFEAEMNEHIAKPIDVDKLNSVLKRFLL